MAIDHTCQLSGEDLCIACLVEQDERELSPVEQGIVACQHRHAPRQVERPVVGSAWRPHVPGSCQLAYQVRSALERTNGKEEPAL
jgi:hypothetical protein